MSSGKWWTSCLGLNVLTQILCEVVVIGWGDSFELMGTMHYAEFYVIAHIGDSMTVTMKIYPSIINPLLNVCSSVSMDLHNAA